MTNSNQRVFLVLCIYLAIIPTVWAAGYILRIVPLRGDVTAFLEYGISFCATLLLILGTLTRDRKQLAVLHLQPWHWTAIVLFWISAILGAYLAAPNPEFAYGRLILLTSLVFGGFATYIWFQNLEERKNFELAAAFCAGSILYAMCILPAIPDFVDKVGIHWNEAFVPYFNVRRYTNNLSVTIPALTAIWIWLSIQSAEPTRHASLWKTVTFLSLCGLWSVLFWAGSRAPALAIACAVLVIFLVGQPYRRLIVKGSLYPAVIGSIVSLFLPRPTGAFGTWSRLLDTGRYESLNRLGSNRIQVWSEAWRLFLENPWFGNGHGQFPLQESIPKNIRYLSPHNFPLEVLHDFGLVGGLSIMAIVYGGIIKMLLHARKHGLTPVALLGLLVVTTLAVESIFDRNITIFIQAVPFVVFWAMAAASQTRQKL